MCCKALKWFAKALAETFLALSFALHHSTEVLVAMKTCSVLPWVRGVGSQGDLLGEILLLDQTHRVLRALVRTKLKCPHVHSFERLGSPISATANVRTIHCRLTPVVQEHPLGHSVFERFEVWPCVRGFQGQLPFCTFWETVHEFLDFEWSGKDTTFMLFILPHQLFQLLDPVRNVSHSFGPSHGHCSAQQGLCSRHELRIILLEKSSPSIQSVTSPAACDNLACRSGGLH